MNTDNDGRTGVAAVAATGFSRSVMLLRTVNESTCPVPRSAPVTVRFNDIDTRARVSMRCASDTPDGIVAPLT